MNSTEYNRIMSDSVFTPCPKGNSVEQYRIYEAIEVGSIPVICQDNGHAKERLPPEFHVRPAPWPAVDRALPSRGDEPHRVSCQESPILFVDDWKDAPAAMMAAAANPDALLRRQQELLTWWVRG